MGRQSRFPVEVRERAVRLVLEHAGEDASQWAAVVSTAGKMGCAPETPRSWVRTERDSVERPGMTTSEKERLKELEREVREVRQLRRANEILRKASAFFRAGGGRPPTSVMVASMVLLRTGHMLKVARGFEEEGFARVVALLEGG
jgi:transposase